jgi:hypothetical protein
LSYSASLWSVSKQDGWGWAPCKATVITGVHMSHKHFFHYLSLSPKYYLSLC